MLKKILKYKYLLFILLLVLIYSNFSYKGESIKLLTKYATNYNKDFMVENENCSEDLDELNLPLGWVVRNHKATDTFKRDVVLIFLKQYNCQFSKHGQSYEVKRNLLFGSKLGNRFGNIVSEYDGYGEFVTTFDAYSVIDKIKGLSCDKFIQKELNITYRLYKQRGMEPEKYYECNNNI